MKNILFVLALTSILSVNSALALTFKAGANAGTVTEEDLMTALRQGKGSLNGKKIVVKPGAEVPAAMKTKWMERQLSGSDAPTEGAASADVIFVEAF